MCVPLQRHADHGAAPLDISSSPDPDSSVPQDVQQLWVFGSAEKSQALLAELLPRLAQLNVLVVSSAHAFLPLPTMEPTSSWNSAG